MSSDVPPQITVEELLKEIAEIASKYAEAFKKEDANLVLDKEETAKAVARLIDNILNAVKNQNKELLLRSQWGRQGCTPSEKRISQVLGDDEWCRQLKVFKSKVGASGKFVGLMYKMKGDRRPRQSNVIKFKKIEE